MNFILFVLLFTVVCGVLDSKVRSSKKLEVK
jgi:hypothetical protein